MTDEHTEPPSPAVLMVLPWSPDAIGGVSEVVINLHRAFARAGILRPRVLVESYPHRNAVSMNTETLGPVDGVYLMHPDGSDRRLRHALVFLARLPGALVRLRGYLQRHTVRAINVHYPSLSALGLVLATRLYDRRVPVVLSFHGSDLNAARSADAVGRLLWRILLRRCDAATACSHALAAEIRAVLPEAATRLHVIRGGVDIDACRRAARSAALPAALIGRRYLACVATFEHKKGQDVLIAAFRAIAGEFPDLHLALVGRTGPTLAALRASVATDPLRERILFLTDCNHASALAILSTAELLAHPARHEPFGIVILEAAALGVPVVASRVGGIPEIVEDEHSGRLVPADDPALLAAAVATLLRDPATARAHADALAARAASAFSWQPAMEAYARLFKASRAPAPPDGAAHSGG
jgi:glycosyltransferase involved in cell wall biosynthesis